MLSSLSPHPHLQVQHPPTQPPPLEQPEGLEASHPTIKCTAGLSCGSQSAGAFSHTPRSLPDPEAASCPPEIKEQTSCQNEAKQGPEGQPRSRLEGVRSDVVAWGTCGLPCLDTGGTSSDAWSAAGSRTASQLLSAAGAGPLARPAWRRRASLRREAGGGAEERHTVLVSRLM